MQRDIYRERNTVYNTPYAVYDCLGKSIKTSGNRFYMASYSSDTVIKKGIIYVLNRKKKTATAVDTVQGDADGSFTVPKAVKVGKVSYKVTKR